MGEESRRTHLGLDAMPRSPDAHAGDSRKLLRLFRLHPLLFGISQNGAGDRVLALHFGAGDGGEQFGSADAGAGQHIGHFGAGMGERAGFIEGNHLDSAQLFEVRPALEKYPVAGRVGNRTEQRCGHANHQRAGRSDRQQHHAIVEIVSEAHAEKRGHDGDEQGHGDNHA